MLKVHELFSEATSMFKMFERNMRILVAVDILWGHSFSTFERNVSFRKILKTFYINDPYVTSNS